MMPAFYVAVRSVGRGAPSGEARKWSPGGIADDV